MLRLMWARNHLKQAQLLLQNPDPALHLHDLRNHLQHAARHLFPLLTHEDQKEHLFRPWGPWSLILFHFRLGQITRLVVHARLLLQDQPSPLQVLEAYQSMLHVHLMVGHQVSLTLDVEPG